jgi:hypothetical protein
MEMSDTEFGEALAYCLENDILSLGMNGDELEFKIGERCQELLPELYAEHMLEINDSVTSLIEKGYVEIDGLDEHGEMTFKLTELGMSTNE